MASARYYRNLANDLDRDPDPVIDLRNFGEMINRESGTRYTSFEKLITVDARVHIRGGVDGAPLTRVGNNEHGRALTAADHQTPEAYFAAILAEDSLWRGQSHIESGMIRALERPGRGPLGTSNVRLRDLIFSAYRYHMEHRRAKPDERYILDPAFRAGALLLGSEAGVDDLFEELDVPRLPEVEEAEEVEAPLRLQGEEAVDFLLNRQQRVLATVNERIIKEYFDNVRVLQNNVIQVSTEDESMLINYLLKRPDLLPFFAIRTPYLSLLVPKIRLFKKVYERQDDGSFAAADLGTLEFTFKSFTENLDIEQITSSKFGRSGGAGIKSANWSYEGTNPETVKSFVNFDISLFFQSLSDFIGSDVASTNEALRDPENVDLISLIGAGIGVADKETGQIRFKFEITAQLGWEIERSINHDLASDQYIADLKRIIGETNTNLRLSLREHSVNFNEDGTLTLDISYFSAIDEVFTDETLNILRIGLAEGSAIQSIEEASDSPDPSTSTGETGRIVRPEFDLCAASRRVATGDETSDSEEESPPTAEEIAISAALQGTDDDSIIQNYNNIFSKLIEGDKIYRVEINVNHISTVIVQDHLRDRSLFTEDANDPVGNQARMRARANRRTVVARYFTEQQLRTISTGDNFKVNQVIITAPLIADSDAASVNTQANNADVADETLLTDESLTAAFNRQIVNNYSGGEGSMLRIDFVRLGDILDNIIAGLKDIPGGSLQEREKDFVFLTGLYTYRETASGIRKAYNYSDMLISIDGFRSFFIEKIVRPLKVRYSLTSFIIDIANKFSYVNSVRLASQGTFVSAEGRPTFAAFQAPDIGLSENMRGAAIRDAWNRHDLDPTRYFREPLYVGSLDEITPTVPVSGEALREVSYFILRSTGDIIERKGDEEDDIEAGIYHLKIGSDRGILKSIKFRKDEIRGRREGRIVRAGGLNLAALREKYDATITIFGAPFIFPGMFVYVNPSLIGYGAGPNSAARVLGLGGYYFINKVGNSINADGTFETEIEASWNAFAGTDCARPALDIITPPPRAKTEILPADVVVDAPEETDTTPWYYPDVGPPSW